MRVDVFSIFPEFFAGPLDASLLGRARTDGVLDVRLHDLREHTTDRHRTVDDAPYGGGAGMVMMPEPLFASVEAADPPRPLFLLAASGRCFDQAMARELAAGDGFSLLCGRYEGVDQRVADHLCDGELSVGDFVLAGGEAAAVIVIDAVTRLVPGVMGNDESGDDESFSIGADASAQSSGLLEYPQYTRPAEFRGHSVPDVLRSGDHARV
ncbi:MAG: tRNA (guanosine(37)-N1)-methyltransferase TrmD, partial [Acidimicrobiia bacterium]